MYRQIALILILASIVASNDDDQGKRRLQDLKARSLQTYDRIIQFSKSDYEQYAMKYPRPYDLVIYFTAKSCKLCVELYPEFTYMVDLYDNFGAIQYHGYPTFFVKMTYSSEITYIYQNFGFTTAPNLVVSKPHMAVVSEIQRKGYLQSFKWSISYTDGHVTTHKMLDFVNKRTEKNVVYKPTFITMCKMFFGFIAVALAGVYIYTQLKSYWTNWVFWLVGSLLIYLTCCSGIVYDIIHDVPFGGRDQKTGQAQIFSPGNREQYGAEGWIISFTIVFLGLLFIAIILAGEKLKERYSAIVGLVGVVLIYYIVSSLESVYKSKGWYGPNFFPPEGYLKGPLSRDQGNNI